MNAAPDKSHRFPSLHLSPALLMVIASALVLAIAGCSSNPDKPPKPKKPRKPRDPVEQKVFYSGWWPEHW